MNDLSKRLRALAAHEHDDLSIAAEAADALDAQGWRPIAEAPRDGSMLLLFVPGFGSVIGPSSFELGVGDCFNRWWLQGGPALVPTHWQIPPAPPEQGDV